MQKARKVKTRAQQCVQPELDGTVFLTPANCTMQPALGKEVAPRSQLTPVLTCADNQGHRRKKAAVGPSHNGAAANVHEQLPSLNEHLQHRH